MKKGIKSLAAAALAISALTPVVAASAAENVENGVYTSTNFYTLDAFKKLSTSQKSAALTANGAVVVIGGQVYKATDVLSASDSQLPTLGTSTDAYTTAAGNKLVSGQPLDHTTAPVGELKVESVSAINASEIQVKFNQAVAKSTVVEGTGAAQNLANGVITITPLTTEGTAASTPGSSIDALLATLSEDGKTLTIKADTGAKFNGRYAITIVEDKIVAKDSFDKKLAAYSTTLVVNDLTRPTLKSVTYSTPTSVVLEFSETVVKDAAFAVTAKRSDNVELHADSKTTLTTGANYTVSGNKITVNLAASPALNAADQNKDIQLALVGIADANGNLVSPNPLTVTVKQDTTDQAKPEISTIKLTDANTMEVKFNKPVSTVPTIKVGATPITVTASNVTIDGTDKSLVKVKLDTASGGDFAAGLPTGLQNVEFSAFVGANGVTGDTVTKVVNFTSDQVKPTVTATAVEKINGVEYLVLTYSEEVKLPASYSSEVLNGNKVVDYVTTAQTITPKLAATTTPNEAEVSLYETTATTTATKSNKVKINLSNLAKADYNSYTIPAGLVVDLFANASAAKTDVAFKRSENTAAGKVSTVLKVAGSPDLVNVTFDTAVDPQSALNKANYTVEGATVESVILTSNTVAQLKLAKNSNTFTGPHTVTINGVKTVGLGNIASYTGAATLDENVKPTVTKVAITSVSTVELTFSEAVLGTATSGNFAVDLVLNGVATTATVATESTSTSTAADKITLTLTTPLSTADIGKTLTVKPGSAIGIKDGVGNVLDFTTISTTVTQANIQ